MFLATEGRQEAAYKEQSNDRPILFAAFGGVLALALGTGLSVGRVRQWGGVVGWPCGTAIRSMRC